MLVNGMSYRVHLRSRGDVNYRKNVDVDPNCWLTNNPEIVFESESLDEAETNAYSHLGRDPTDTAFVSSSDGRLIRTLRCDPADELREQLGERIGYLFGICILLFGAFLFAAVFGRAGVAFVVCIGSLVLYSALALLKVQNELESLFVSFLVEVLCLFATRQAFAE